MDQCLDVNRPFPHTDIALILLRQDPWTIFVQLERKENQEIFISKLFSYNDVKQKEKNCIALFFAYIFSYVIQNC
jgi:hypothetical protein